jgi:zinc and cadmium transporter
MSSPITYTLLSVILVSLISFIGLFTLSIKTKKLNKILLYLISFSTGALLGDAFLHLLPEIVKSHGFTIQISIYTLLGIAIFFVLEKFIHWQHCHLHLTENNHIHPFAYTNLLGDALHNFIDGIIIATSYIISIPVGIATTIAVILHEIPQEIGDFGVLLHAGFSKSKALLLNFASALVAILGALLTFLLGNTTKNMEIFLVPIAAGGFIYIALSDLIPEIHKTTDTGKSIIQLISFILGITIMAVLLYLD